MTRPKIGSIIRYPYWQSNERWLVLRHHGIFGNVLEAIKISVVRVGSSESEIIGAYTGEEKLDIDSSGCGLYWEYVT